VEGGGGGGVGGRGGGGYGGLGTGGHRGGGILDTAGRKGTYSHHLGGKHLILPKSFLITEEANVDSEKKAEGSSSTGDSRQFIS